MKLVSLVFGLPALCLAQSLSIQPSVTTVKAGQSYTVDIVATGVRDLFTYQFALTFPTGSATVNSISQGPFLATGGATFFIPGQPGGAQPLTAGSLIGAIRGVSGTGTLASFALTAKTAGAVQVSLANAIVLDSATGAMSISLVTPGSATTVTSVSSRTPNGTYGRGAAVLIAVQFSHAVNVTGTPQLALNSGGTAKYTSGSGSSTLSFTYNVGPGENSAVLDYVSSTALTLNGGTMKDTTGAAANLKLPAPGAAGSLSANSSIIINTATRTASVTAVEADRTTD